jgi:hypothetical protein
LDVTWVSQKDEQKALRKDGKWGGKLVWQMASKLALKMVCSVRKVNQTFFKSFAQKTAKNKQTKFLTWQWDEKKE